MRNRHTWIAACTAAVALAVVTLAAAHISASPLLSRREFLTFSQPVALPGVSLVPGTYVFELADPDTSNVVRVRDRVSNRVAFTGFTFRINRPVGKRDSKVVLGEAKKGNPAPVLAWYPTDQELGYQFIYRDGR
jgi:hypothetical protein